MKWSAFCRGVAVFPAAWFVLLLASTLYQLLFLYSDRLTDIEVTGRLAMKLFLIGASITFWPAFSMSILIAIALLFAKFSMDRGESDS